MATAVKPRKYDLGNFVPKPKAITGPTLVVNILAPGWNRKHDGRPKGQSTMLKPCNSPRGTFLIMVYHVRNVAGPAWRVAATNEKGTTGLRSNCAPMVCTDLATGEILKFETQKLAMDWANAQNW